MTASADCASKGRSLHPAHRRIEAGLETNCTIVAGLVDTNVLIYAYDLRFPQKQALAADLLRQGILNQSILLPHQVLVEFMAVVTRQIARGQPLLSVDDAHRVVEELLVQFPVIYPTENTVRTALRGTTLYKLSWFDAHLWAYADERGLDTLWSEDFQDGRLYGRVRVQNPFRGSSVHDPEPPPYGR